MAPLLLLTEGVGAVPMHAASSGNARAACDGETMANDRIRECFNDGNSLVDLSCLALTTVPQELASLALFTTYAPGEGVSNRFNLYLSSNLLRAVPPALFQLTNLRVLSLRNNFIERLPRDLANLVRLEELSVGGNRLAFLPFELERLPKLRMLSANPNPFAPASLTEAPAPLTLQEHALRAVVNNGLESQASILPLPLRDELEEEATCCQCGQRVFRTRHERVVRKPLLNSPDVAIRYLYCTIVCLDAHVAASTTAPQAA